MTEQLEYDHLFKIIVVGDHGIGKSSFMLRYTDDLFIQNMMQTIGTEFKNKMIRLQGKMNKLQIWDIAGDQRFRSITAAYYRRVNGLFLMFDITNRDSFKKLDMYMEEIERNTQINSRSITLIGLKSDLVESRKISKQQAQRFSKQHHLEYMEVSSKENINIDSAFELLTQQMLTIASINNINHPIRRPLPDQRLFRQQLVEPQPKFKWIQIIVPAALLALFIITAFLFNS